MEKDMIYTTDEVAVMLKVQPLTVRKLVSNGKLKASKVGRLLRFQGSDIEYFLQSNQTESKKKISTVRDLLQFQGTWAGGKEDAEKVMKYIAENKSEAEF